MDLEAQLAAKDAEIAALRAEVRMLVEALGRVTATLERLGPQTTPAPVAPGPTTTLREIWDLYDAAHIGRYYWWKKARTLLRPSLERFGDRPVVELKRSDWLHWRTVDRAHIKPSTRNIELKRWRACIRWAVQNEHLAVPPAWRHAWDGIDLEPNAPPRQTEYTEDDLTAVLREAPEPFDLFFLMAYDCPIRRDELLAIEWSWIDWDNGCVHIPAKAVKGKREPRTIALLARDVDRLRMWRSTVRENLKTARSPYVFVRLKTGRRFSSNWATSTARRVLDACGIEGAPGEQPRLHDTRATAAMNRFRAGASVLAVMSEGGWKTLGTVNKHYARKARLEDVLEARDKAEERLANLRRAQRPTPAHKATPDTDL